MSAFNPTIWHCTSCGERSCESQLNCHECNYLNHCHPCMKKHMEKEHPAVNAAKATDEAWERFVP